MSMLLRPDKNHFLFWANTKFPNIDQAALEEGANMCRNVRS